VPPGFQKYVFCNILVSSAFQTCVFCCVFVPQAFQTYVFYRIFATRAFQTYVFCRTFAFQALQTYVFCRIFATCFASHVFQTYVFCCIFCDPSLPDLRILSYFCVPSPEDTRKALKSTSGKPPGERFLKIGKCVLEPLFGRSRIQRLSASQTHVF
jgi:hypothetical protein